MEAQLQPGEEETLIHAPEPWRQDGRYVRDALDTIVVRGRSPADARRIVAAVNATRGMPTEALEGWSVEDVSDPATRPELEIELPEIVRAETGLAPPRADGALEDADLPSDPVSPLFERRVFQRRVINGEVLLERRRSERRRGSSSGGG